MVEDCECRVQCLRIVGFRVEGSGADIGVEAVNQFDVLLGLRGLWYTLKSSVFRVQGIEGSQCGMQG
jgi:hypothetical protein